MIELNNKTKADVISELKQGEMTMKGIMKVKRSRFKSRLVVGQTGKPRTTMCVRYSVKIDKKLNQELKK